MIRPVATVFFTPQLQRFTATPQVETGAATLREALEAAFAVNPKLRGYVLDDQQHLRANVVCFIDGRRCTERVALADPLRSDSRIHVLQALSGG
jgi:sulfur-carrier protein